MFLPHLRSLNMIKKKITAPVIFQTKHSSTMGKTYEVWNKLGYKQGIASIIILFVLIICYVFNNPFRTKYALSKYLSCYHKATLEHEAVNCINTLQTNYSYIQNAAKKGILSHSVTYSTTIAETQKYLLRTGISLEQLDKLSVIHVAGTKGKGSTCAFCESILSEYGYKTGFYSSPHLVVIRERIKLNGKPLSKDVFAENVFKIYNQLMDNREHDNDMPGYFRFLTVLAFNIFLAEKVDVAIIEVGIGGEYDCTNIIRNTPIVGITSLGLDHVSVLGSSLEQIAWQKAGIMKNNSKVFTIKQPDNAMKIIQERSIERKCSLEIAPNFESYNWTQIPKLGINGDIQKINASLAIQLAHNWISNCGSKNKLNINNIIPEKTKKGLENCKWPGRNQILKTSSHTFYLDGAHTAESLEICAEWFQNTTNNCKHRALIFNTTGDRNSEELLKKLITLNFNNIIFVPNISSSVATAGISLLKRRLRNTFKKTIFVYRKQFLDQANFVNTENNQIQRCQLHKNIWLKLKNNQNVSVHSSVEDAIQSLPSNVEYHVLVTGSLHLVGAALTVLDPELKTF